MDKRRMCPNCRAFITTSDRVCPYCEVQLGPRAADLRSAEVLQGFLPRAYATSVIILSINVALYVLMVVANVRLSQAPVATTLGNVWRGFSIGLLELFGAKYAPAIYQDGEWWRLLMAGFLHGSLLHIAMNMWVMMELAAEVEQFYGTSRLLVMYVGSTITGFALSLWWAPMSVSIGASAACFGLIGGMMAIGLQRDNPMARAIRAYYRKWAIYGLIFSFMPFMHIDIAAHVGGLVGGFVLGYVMGLPSLRGSPRERFWQIAAGVAIALTLYAFLAEFRFYEIVMSRA